MELWDAYTRNGAKTGGVLVRGQRMWPGIYHMVCEVLVRHADGTYLCMIRSRKKPNYPLYPECTAGGSALLGEDPLDCVHRELLEETGIDCHDFRLVAQTVREQDSSLFWSYICTVDWPKDRITLQEGETEDFKWVSEEEFMDLLNSGRMIPEQMERMGDYYRKLGYLK